MYHYECENGHETVVATFKIKEPSIVECHTCGQDAKLTGAESDEPSQFEDFSKLADKWREEAKQSRRKGLPCASVFDDCANGLEIRIMAVRHRTG